MNVLFKTEALQHEPEIAAFCELVRNEGCNSYLEIGSKFGGSLWRVGQVLLPRSRIVAVDLPGGTIKWHKSEPSLKACAEALRAMGHLVTLIWGNSADEKVIEQVRDAGPYDLALLDGDHRMAGLSIDWHSYGEMARIIAFHDISWSRPADWSPNYSRIDVPMLWDSLRKHFRSHEIKLDPSGQDNGIGVLWRHEKT